MRRHTHALVAIVLAGSASAQQTQLQLSDAEFWNIFSTYSEAGGTFTTDNLTSNEPAVGLVVADLLARGRKGGAYIGVGPEQNYTYITALEPEVAFIVDIRRDAAVQHLMFKALFELSANRAEFIERLFALPGARPAPPADASIHDIWMRYLNLAPDSTIAARILEEITRHLTVTRQFALSAADRGALARIYSAIVRTGPSVNYLTGLAVARAPFRSANFASLTMIVDSTGAPRSFLASPGHFQLVKERHLRNLIIPVVGDFAGTSALRAVAGFLRERRLVVNAFYVSNVEQYLFRPQDRRREFYENVAALPLDSGSVLIRPGSAASRPLPAPPFTPQSSDSAVRVYVDLQRVAQSGPRPTASLCPALLFLDAFRVGRVSVYADAERCAGLVSRVPARLR